MWWDRLKPDIEVCAQHFCCKVELGGLIFLLVRLVNLFLYIENKEVCVFISCEFLDEEASWKMRKGSGNLLR